TISNGTLYLEEGSKAGAFRLSDGALSFEISNPYDALGGSNASALAAGNNVLVMVRGWRMYALDAALRKPLWQASGYFQGQATVGNGVVYVSTSDPDVHLEAHR